MEFHFGVVNTIATAFTILITLLNIIVYKLRQIQEANLRDIISPSQLPDENLGESSNSQSSSKQLCRHFLLGEILVATNNFDDALVIGQGGFGKVYKGVIDNGSVKVAIKRLNPMSRQGAPQFWMEVELLSRFRHSHLVSLVGCCYNTHEMILVYEYMPRGSLADHLYKTRSNLSWIQRVKICIGAGQGLEYLHTGTGINNRVIHRDIKSSNILLDESWAAKVSDFGLSKIGPANQDLTHVSTNVKGTYGFLDPEYMTTHRLTRKSDVYSFGVVLLELLSGKRAMDPKVCEEHWDLAAWAKECIRKKEVEQIIDPYLKHEILPDSLKEFVQIAEQCLQFRSRKRPTMTEVLASLERVLALQERMDSTMLDEDFMNLGWTTSNNQENLDDSAVQRNEHMVINDNVLSGDANLQLPVRHSAAGITPFKRMTRFFFGKSRVDSGYDFDTIKAATNKFSLKLGEGRYGFVYKGVLLNGQEIAVKMFSSKEPRAELQFRNEISLLAKLQHSNLVSLLGFCSKGISKRLLIYEFVPNLTLDNYIYDPLMRERLLDWEVCKKIIRGIAEGITYLHEDSSARIIHRHLKPVNILMDLEMNPKIAGFGLAISCLGVESGMCVSCICGTYGYMAPEYLQTCRVSVKTDVYSFGILVLNIISGRKANSYYASDGTDKLLQDYAKRNWSEGIFWDILISPCLSETGTEVIMEIKRCIHIALLCIQEEEVLRPTMSEVLSMLNNPSQSLPEPSFPTSSMPTSFIDDMPNSLIIDDMPNSLIIDDMPNSLIIDDMPNNLSYSVNEDSSSELSPR